MSTGQSLRERIESELDNSEGKPSRDAWRIVFDLLDALESGEVRAAERDSNGTWNAVPWVKRGILLGFQVGTLTDMSPESGPFRFFDKSTYPPRNLRIEDGVRVVPGGSTIRRGAYVAPGVVCMAAITLEAIAKIRDNAAEEEKAARRAAKGVKVRTESDYARYLTLGIIGIGVLMVLVSQAIPSPLGEALGWIRFGIFLLIFGFLLYSWVTQKLTSRTIAMSDPIQVPVPASFDSIDE